MVNTVPMVGGKLKDSEGYTIGSYVAYCPTCATTRWMQDRTFGEYPNIVEATVCTECKIIKKVRSLS